MLAHDQQQMNEEFLTKDHVQTWIDQTTAQLKSLEVQFHCWLHFLQRTLPGTVQKPVLHSVLSVKQVPVCTPWSMVYPLSKADLSNGCGLRTEVVVPMQSMFDNNTLLIFHGAVYPMLLDCKSGGDHANQMGKRTHIIQLNKAALHVMQQ